VGSTALLRLFTATLLASLAGACSLTPEYLRPDVPTPATFSSKSTSPEPSIAPAWWRAFRSQTLNRLVAEANSDNTDIAAALRRIDQSRAQLRIAGASLFPSIDASGSANFSRTKIRGSSPTHDFDRSAEISLAYDFDIFGGNRAGVASARAIVVSRYYDHDAVQLAIQSEVAIAYMNMLLARERLRISDDTITNFEEVLRIADARLEAGAATSLDVTQQRSALATARAGRALFVQQVNNAENALAVLLGDAAGTVHANGTGIAALKVPRIDPGQPAAILYRRPDIKRVEAELIAANADIGVARAALFPSLTLDLSAAISANPVTTVLNAGSSLLAPIFQGGRLRAGVALSEAEKAEIVEIYRKTVLVALQEVEDALAAIRSAQRRVSELNTALNEARTAYRLSRERYEAGAIDFQTLLDAQRTLFNAEDSLVFARYDRLIAAVELIRALGGGGVDPPVEDKTSEGVAKVAG
jgi:NodT family efflux transporter outer membrane factor (OMF) lipoprotein